MTDWRLIAVTLAAFLIICTAIGVVYSIADVQDPPESRRCPAVVTVP